MPPAWVPAFPPRLEAALALAGQPPAPSSRRATPRRLLLAALLSALGAVCCALALKGSLTLDGILGKRGVSASSPAELAPASPTGPALASLPALVRVSQDSAGSTIDRASFDSRSLEGEGSFLAYLPPGYASTTSRYPVLYLLHGRNGHADSFLEVGLQETLDRLIAQGTVPPMIAIMIQDRSGLNNWRDLGHRRSATYVVEVQELVDRMLPTTATRAGRAILGSSMGGFGSMNVALGNPGRFAVVESWLGFFNGLGSQLRAATPTIKRLGLHAFLYGAAADPVADPEEDPAFAAELRAAGAHAAGVIYPGGHSLGKVAAHLETMLVFAGHSLRAAERRAAAEEARARAPLERSRKAAASTA